MSFAHRHNLPVPFSNAEEAWFWFINAQIAKNEGARIIAGQGKEIRPCEPVDIYKVVERLYRNRRLLMDHIKIMRHYGLRGVPPDYRRIREILAAKLWDEAMNRINEILKQKGIVE